MGENNQQRALTSSTDDDKKIPLEHHQQPPTEFAKNVLPIYPSFHCLTTAHNSLPRPIREKERERETINFCHFWIVFLLGPRGHGSQNERCSKAMRDATEAIRLLTEWPPQNHPHFVAQVMAKELNRNLEIVALWFWFVLFLSCLCFVALGRGVGVGDRSRERSSSTPLHSHQNKGDTSLNPGRLLAKIHQQQTHEKRQKRFGMASHQWTKG